MPALVRKIAKLHTDEATRAAVLTNSKAELEPLIRGLTECRAAAVSLIAASPGGEATLRRTTSVEPPVTGTGTAQAGQGGLKVKSHTPNCP